MLKPDHSHSYVLYCLGRSVDGVSPVDDVRSDAVIQGWRQPSLVLVLPSHQVGLSTVLAKLFCTKIAPSTPKREGEHAEFTPFVAGFGANYYCVIVFANLRLITRGERVIVVSLPGVKKKKKKKKIKLGREWCMTHLVSGSTLSSIITKFLLRRNRPRSQFGYSCFVLVLK